MIRIYQIDAFTDKPYQGNPAGVCILESPAAETWMQKAANEMNLAETAFLWPEENGYHLRWFTPETEVELCGHATLASAYTLWEQHIVPWQEAILFNTLSGVLRVKQKNGWVTMDFPSRFPDQKMQITDDIKAVFGSNIKNMAANDYGYWVVELAKSGDVIDFQPDFTKILSLGKYLIIITAPSANASYDFVSRVFAPAFGIHEDSVTGAAHCALGPYWYQKTGKPVLTGYQASKRGGIVKVDVSSGNDRVNLMGKAVKVMEADLLY